MGLANKLTAARIVAIPVFMFFLLGGPQPAGSYIAAAIFAAAAATDTVDGYVARFQKRVTVFGQLFDPVADKLLVSAALISLVQLGSLPAWVAVVIISREVAVSALRLVAMAEHQVMAATAWGKAKTVSQIIAIIAVMVGPPVEIAGAGLGSILMGIAVALTVISGFHYFARSRPMLVSANIWKPR